MNRARTIDLTRAMKHPARRRVLRRLHAEDRPCSSLELARESSLSASCTAYHLRVLQACRITKPVERQAVPAPAAARHRSIVSEDRWVRAHLATTHAEDEAARSEGSRPQ
jgi:hypothetical protein